MVVRRRLSNHIRALHHAGERPALSFFRDSNGLEADLVEGGPVRMQLTEIKSGATWSSKWDRNIRRIGALADIPVTYRVVHGGDDPVREIRGTEYRPWFLTG